MWQRSPDGSSRNGRAGGWVFLVAAAALATAAVHAQLAPPPLLAWRCGALAVGTVLALTGLRRAILVVLFAVPLLGSITRSLGAPDLSLPEHLLLPVLLWGGVRQILAPAPRPAPGVDRWMVAWLAVVGVSALRALWPYAAIDAAPGSMLVDAMGRHFSFSVLDYGRGPFLVVHAATVLLEGGLWFVLLTAPAAALRARDLRRALLVSSLAVVAVGIAQHVSPVAMPQYFRKAQPFLLRINGTLPDPNTLGAFLVLVLPIGLVAASECRRGRLAACAWTALVGYCLWASVSRSAWAGLAGAGALAAVLVGRNPAALGLALSARSARRLRRAPGLAALAAAAVALVVSTADLAGGITYRGAHRPWEIALMTLDWKRPVGELVPSRPVHWRAALAIWRDFPLLGAGVGKYPLLKNRYLPDDTRRWLFFTEPHCYFLKVLAETGAVGLAAFAALLASIFALARRAFACADVPARRRLAAGALGVAAFLLCSLAQDPLALREMQYLFWAVVASIVLEAAETASG